MGFDDDQIIVHTPDTPQTPEPDTQPAEDQAQVTQEMFSAIESGSFREEDRYKYTFSLENYGRVDATMVTSGLSSIDLTGGGLTEPEYSTKIMVTSYDTPKTFKQFSIDAPAEVVERYESKIERQRLGGLKDAQNWERIGRKNAYKHKDSDAEVAIRKDSYGGYQATFTRLPGTGTQSVSKIEGGSLAERLSDALSKIHPRMFNFENIGILKDTLRSELGMETPNEPADTTAQSGDTAGGEPAETGADEDSAQESVATSADDLPIKDMYNWQRQGRSGAYNYWDTGQQGVRGVASVNSATKDMPAHVVFTGVPGLKRRVVITDIPNSMKNHDQRLAYALAAISEEHLTDPNMMQPIPDSTDRAAKVEELTEDLKYTKISNYQVFNIKDNEMIDVGEAYRVSIPGIAYANFVVHRPIDGRPEGWVFAEEETAVALADILVPGTNRDQVVKKGLNNLLNYGEDRFLDSLGRARDSLTEKGWTPPGEQTEADAYEGVDLAGLIQTIGMNWTEADYLSLDPAEKRAAIQTTYDELLEKHDFDVPDDVQRAVNELTNLANAEDPPAVGGGAPTGIPINSVIEVPDIETGQKPTGKPFSIPKVDKHRKYTPKMKLWIERSRRAYMSGYKNLSLLGEVGEAIKRAADRAIEVADRGSNRDLRRLEPHQKALTALVKKRTPKGSDTQVVHAELSEAIYRFIEDNKPIDDAELRALAEKWKETWREVLLTHDMNMMQLRAEVAALPGEERVVIRRSDGTAAKEWHPILPGHVWQEDSQTFKRRSDGAELSVEDAIRQSNRLYLPHMYPSEHWNQIVDQVNSKIITRLDAAQKKKGNTIPGFTFDKATNTWTFTRTEDTFTDKDAAIEFAKEYWTEQYALGQQMLAGRDSGVIGRYGHLEVERQTTDKLYLRDVSRLLEHSEQVWKRIGEIIAWGQYDPVLGNWPRLAQYVGRIAETPQNMRDYALWTVADTLMKDESDMFERLPAFRAGEETAAGIMRHWNTPDIEKMRTENPDRFDDETLNALAKIGMVAQKPDGTYQLAGENEDVQRSNFIRHMVPYFESLHLREETVMKIARGIGHWEPGDSLNSNASRVWSALNHITTTLTLGIPTAIQNLGEVPLLASLSGSKNLMAGLQRLASDPEFRRMLPQLAAALNKARDYMVDNDLQAKYLEISLFTPTERWSRLAGVAVGWITAENAIRNYLADGSEANAQRLEELNMSVEAIENYKRVLAGGAAPDFDALLQEAEQRTRDGAMMIDGLRNPNASRPSNIHVDLVGDEIARAARFVSVRVFKGYNALTMPDFLTKKDPMIRTFFKFKSWAGQMHEYMMSSFLNAGRAARKGDFGPAWRLAQGMAWMGLSGAAIGGLFAALSGRDDEDRNRLLQSLAMTHTLGIASMVIEMSMYSEGNPYRAANMLSSAFGSPTVGVAARIGGEAISGDLGGTLETTILQLPGVRDARRLGGGALFGGDDE